MSCLNKLCYLIITMYHSIVLLNNYYARHPLNFKLKTALKLKQLESVMISPTLSAKTFAKWYCFRTIK